MAANPFPGREGIGPKYALELMKKGINGPEDLEKILEGFGGDRALLSDWLNRYALMRFDHAMRAATGAQQRCNAKLRRIEADLNMLRNAMIPLRRAQVPPDAFVNMLRGAAALRIYGDKLYDQWQTTRLIHGDKDLLTVAARKSYLGANDSAVVRKNDVRRLLLDSPAGRDVEGMLEQYFNGRFHLERQYVAWGRTVRQQLGLADADLH